MLAPPAHSYHTSHDLSPAIFSDCHRALLINRSMDGSEVNKMEKEKTVFSTLIGQEHHSVATPALLCHKEPARSKQNTPLGVFCVPKPLVGGFGGDELVLYGIRELA